MATIHWIASDGDRGIASKSSPAQVPGAAHDAIMDAVGASTVAVPNGGYDADSLTIEAGATVAVSNGFTLGIADTITNGGAID
jgi:hypothetical protein